MNEKKKDFQNYIYSTLDEDPAKNLDHKFYKYFLPYAQTRAAMIRKMLAGELFEDAIELGAGPGDIAAAVADRFTRYVLLDISSYQFSRAPESLKNNRRITFRAYDLDQPLDYPPASFDIALSTSTIEYLTDPIAFVREVNRILRPGGTFILTTMNLAFFVRRLQLLLGKIPTFNAAPGWEGGVLHHFTFPAMERLLTSNGFRVVQKRCSGLCPSLRYWWPNLLASDMIFRCEKTADSEKR